MIVATGPLTSPALAEAIRELTGEDALAFFDAIAPIVHLESIDMSIAWIQSRYDKAGPAATAPTTSTARWTRTQYEAFIDALLAGEKTEFKEWENSTPYFDGCLPIEVMAERGRETLRFGPMKPVGLPDPRTGQRPYAVVQLRQDNALGTLWNMVGFQTKLKHGEQTRIFRMIPGLENARVRAAGRPAPQHLPQQPAAARRHAAPEGACRGCASPGRSPASRAMSRAPRSACWPAASPPPSGWAQRRSRRPPTTALGALLGHITGGADAATFQPMNVNFGLFPPIDEHLRGKARKQALSARALRDFDQWMAAPTPLAAE